MMSATARAQRRGAISQLEFRAEMDRLGFVEQRPRAGMLHEFTHGDCGNQHFTMKMSRETYSAALERLTAEVRAMRRWRA
jgi:hypothetical protein